MKHILILGAGKSATDLIHYLLRHANTYDWIITVGDRDQKLAERKVGGHPRGRVVYFDVHDADLRAKLVKSSDIVASVLPAGFHYLVAEDCLRFGKHLITPSYVSAKESAMDTAFKKAGLLFMGEIGLDPGIDHMSLMKMIEDLQEKGATITGVRSCCGALIAPESDTNPWHYKFTWAPMNVVKAGQGTAQYLKNGQPKYIPYNRLFELYDAYEVEGAGTFEAYANRDSMLYLDKYQLSGLSDFIRCTLRYGSYCDAWNAFVKLGWTDDSYPIINSAQLTYNDLMEAFLPTSAAEDKRDLDIRVAEFLGTTKDSDIMQKLRWLDLFEHRPIRIENATPARILLDLLEEKWKLGDEDLDMVVMLHRIDYTLNGQQHSMVSTLVDKGTDAERTSLAKLVGLPMAMVVKLIATDQLNLTGVHIPVMRQVYDPILQELAEEYGVRFVEQTQKAQV